MPKYFIRLPFYALCMFFLSACLRYVPAYQLSSATGQFAGPDAFYQIERDQQQRLQDFLARRTMLLSTKQGESYQIGVSDLLKINVFEVPEFSSTVRVRPSGTISLSLIGEVEVAGLSESELQDKLTKLLARYVNNPQVEVFIEEYNAHLVSVSGEVAKPGDYPLKHDKYTLTELLAAAGGKTARASGRLILIPSSLETSGAAASANPAAQASSKQQNFGIEIYFDDLFGSITKPPLNVPLLAGDKVMVPDAGMVQVDGEVKSPGSYTLSSRMSLLGSIASAGGLSYSADVHQVQVIRELGNGKKALVAVDLENVALKGGNDIRLRDDDIVRVPSARGRFITRQIVEGINRGVSLGMSGSVP